MEQRLSRDDRVAQWVAVFDHCQYASWPVIFDSVSGLVVLVLPYDHLADIWTQPHLTQRSGDALASRAHADPVGYAPV